MAEEKTEDPTPKKKKESRKEGQVPRTRELGGWLALLAFGALIGTLIEKTKSFFVSDFKQILATIENPEQADAVRVIGESLRFGAFAMIAVGLVAMFIGVIATMAQGGFYIASKAAKPTFSKVSLGKGFKRLFSAQTAWEGAKTLIKTIILGVVCYSAGKGLTPLLAGPAEASAVLAELRSTLSSMVISVAAAGLVMAGADYAFQRRKVGKETRMTKQEVKQEHKNTEGDPLIKSALRSRALAAARNRMMADVATADAVLVNPTHIAIALKYEAASGAPRVVARGAGAVALKIREQAAEHEVPAVRDVVLARALYSSCRVGQEIPLELFGAVAQILAFVINRRTQGLIERGDVHSSPRIEPDLPEITSRRLIPISD